MIISEKFLISYCATLMEENIRFYCEVGLLLRKVFLHWQGLKGTSEKALCHPASIKIVKKERKKQFATISTLYVTTHALWILIYVSPQVCKNAFWNTLPWKNNLYGNKTLIILSLSLRSVSGLCYFRTFRLSSIWGLG